MEATSWRLVTKAKITDNDFRKSNLQYYQTYVILRSYQPKHFKISTNYIERNL